MARRTKMGLIREFEQEEAAEMSPAEVETTAPPTVRNGKITNALYVKIRKQPSFRSDVVDVLRRGDKVSIHKQVGDFYNVSTSVYDDVYVHIDFVEEV